MFSSRFDAYEWQIACRERFVDEIASAAGTSGSARWGV
jgi:hypothetical protein